jgi:PIN domain nuclease of toxin-antitoxin system
MRYLLDTHIALWLLSGDERLPEAAAEIAVNEDHELYLSAASLWEVVIKHRKAPALMPISGGELLRYCAQAAIGILPIRQEHVLTVASLHRVEGSPPHNDPFDQLLIAQSKWDGLILITHDSLFTQYGEPTVWRV